VSAIFVLDASASAGFFLDDEASVYSSGVLSALYRGDHAIAPQIWAYELRNIILMAFRRGRITKEHVSEARCGIAGLAVRLVDPPSYDDLLALAERHNLTVYDAAYLDLAMREHLPLATLDRALIRAAGETGVMIFRAADAAVQ
jgi:predicted nucleic acid-binding protein